MYQLFNKLIQFCLKKLILVEFFVKKMLKNIFNGKCAHF